ncbi:MULTISPECIES: MSMEG_0567/Sll0786 family nitrogen starvation N-acetyltransferase [Rhizobium/Agrobacterium group]|uniref:GCN5 family N-acetyltransferase n=2 Tax=Rhizobium/Agrobacterium group TaxID=227290 RepID=B9K5N3_ALLAM|nr:MULTISPECIES: MSMEG_0567/Sll0786 family nitrogen starvation N-acetyltransferase [Rhizobium/Agrobacterium group]ACM40181.1 GCN5 family N-acetyltransferase [Allorhizobium ampelinum S4]MCF1449113.1 GNAT family N-acetyltransferase [Allorhizobium ampelinum]MCF1494927.1 GNAT family N-acetyltransferase [Allorhizobium ampelinum]MUO28347.1 GNAT family N-acetyltransferase [Agrobacterium vitis]MUO41229.1 GNAT family N-acetyltransferase [Agrobacterium vitis]
MMIEPFSPFHTSEFQVKFATSTWERREAHALRRDVFCREQQIFESDDRDAIDDRATPIVALSMLGVAADRLVGTVRIHEEQPGLWWGSRLAVHEDFRKIGALGATLIRLAVSSANAMGCQTFLANVQVQNGLLFRRLHWDVVEEFEIYGKPHLRMKADLSWYPPCATPEAGFVALAKRAA